MTSLKRGTTAVLVAAVAVIAASGCQQKMATQPAPRPYEESNMFANGQSARPLVDGVVHRGQPLSDDPLVTWLSDKGRKPTHTEQFKAWLREQQKPPVGPDGKPLLDKDGKPLPPFLSAEAAKDLEAQAIQPGAPTDKANFVDTVPFEMTEADLKRGQVLYTAICAECHGGAGYANGKIPERGFLRPPSYHSDPKGQEKDWSRYVKESESGPVVKDYTGNAAGTSRGFYKYGVEIPLKDVPVGYIYQVIYWGYGGMASHEVQLAKPEDRWRVAAFVRVLQHSQAADPAKLPDDVKAELNGKKKAEGNH